MSTVGLGRESFSMVAATCCHIERRTCSVPYFLRFSGVSLLAVNSVRVGLFNHQPRGVDLKRLKKSALSFLIRNQLRPLGNFVK